MDVFLCFSKKASQWWQTLCLSLMEWTSFKVSFRHTDPNSWFQVFKKKIIATLQANKLKCLEMDPDVIFPGLPQGLGCNYYQETLLWMPYYLSRIMWFLQITSLPLIPFVPTVLVAIVRKGTSKGCSSLLFLLFIWVFSKWVFFTPYYSLWIFKDLPLEQFKATEKHVAEIIQHV